MNMNESLENTSINNEEENFYFDKLSGKPYFDFRKMLGRQLFKIRQEELKPLFVIARDTGLSEKMIESAELGRGDFCWETIAKLLDYYKKRVKLYVIDKYTSDEQQAMMQEQKSQKLLAQAEIVIERDKKRDQLEKEIAQCAEIMAKTVSLE